MSASSKLFKNVIFRLFAVFMGSALLSVGAGAIAGVTWWQSLLMEGIKGVATVLVALSWAFSSDGNLTLEEVNQVFNTIQNNRKSGSEKKQVEAALEKVVGEGKE